MKKWIVVTDGDDNEIHYPTRLIELRLQAPQKQNRQV